VSAPCSKGNVGCPSHPERCAPSPHRGSRRRPKVERTDRSRIACVRGLRLWSRTTDRAAPRHGGGVYRILPKPQQTLVAHLKMRRGAVALSEREEAKRCFLAFIALGAVAVTATQSSGISPGQRRRIGRRRGPGFARRRWPRCPQNFEHIGLSHTGLMRHAADARRFGAQIVR